MTIRLFFDVARFAALAMNVAIVFFYFEKYQNKKATVNFYDMLHHKVSKGIPLAHFRYWLCQYRSVLL